MILLDTHIWIWFHLEPELLPSQIAHEFRRPDATFAISSISVWETVMAVQKGRIATSLPAAELVRSWIDGRSLKIVSIDEEIAMLSRLLPFEHSDPADLFIGATAYQLGIPLATADRRLSDLPWLHTIT